MNKRGFYIILLLAIMFSLNDVSAISAIGINPDVIYHGDIITIIINPEENGVYKELYLVDDKGDFVDTIALDCETICYNEQLINYKIPDTAVGKYKLYIFDYSINDYIIKDLSITAKQPSLVSGPKINKHIAIENIKGNSPITITSLDNVDNLVEKGLENINSIKQNNLLHLFPNDDSKIVVSNINELNQDRLQIVSNENSFILELKEPSIVVYELLLKNGIQEDSAKLDYLLSIRGEKNFIIDITTEVRLLYANYIYDKHISEFNEKLDNHKSRLSKSHSKIKSELMEELPNALVESEFQKSFNGITISNVDINDLHKISGIKKIHKNNRVSTLLDASVPLINADDLWQLGYNGSGINIAILDTGVDYTHPDLGGCFGSGCKVVDGYDFVNDDNDPMDDHGHGTHVAATAAGDGILKGVAPSAKIYAYKILNSLGSGFISDIIRAIDQASDPNNDGNFTDHVDIISMSLGGFGNPNDPLSIASDNAVDLGIITVVAAGNSGPFDETIESPGTSRKAITVGASWKTDVPAAFSSHGPVNFNNEVLIKPDILAPGVLICAAQFDSWLEGSAECSPAIADHIAISGTSMATPHVAGIAALLKQAYPNWTPLMIKSSIMINAKDLGYTPIVQGSGRVNTFNAYNTSIFVDKPSISFNNAIAQTSSQILIITNLRSYPIILTLQSTPVTKRGTNITFDVINLNQTILNLNPGESRSIKALLTSPNAGGSFYGVIKINENNRTYRIPYYFVKFSLLNVKAVSTGKFLLPHFMVVDEHLSNVKFAINGFDFFGDSYTFTLESGNYTVIAVGDDNTIDTNYILSSQVELLPGSVNDVILSTRNARKLTLKAISNNNIPLKSGQFKKTVFVNTQSGIASLGYSFSGSGSLGDRIVYISDTTQNSAFDIDVDIVYKGIPQQHPEINKIFSQEYSVVNQEYLYNFYLTEINGFTPDVLQYQPNDFAILNYTFDLPSLKPAAYFNLLAFVSPYDSIVFIPWRSIAAPLNKAYYIKSQHPALNLSNRNWSFSNSMLLNYLKSSNEIEQFGLDASSIEFDAPSIFYGINPKSGDTSLVHFGKTPLHPVQIVTVNENGFDKLKLDGPLMHGYNNKSTLHRYPDLNVISSDGSITNIKIKKPSYKLYKNGTLIQNNLSNQFGWWYGLFNRTLSAGSYIANITIPVDYLVWNTTIITAQLNYPSSDISLPRINEVLISPRFREGSNLSISVDITDNNAVSSVSVLYRYDTAWQSLPITQQGNRFTSIIANIPSNTKKIDIRIIAEDAAGNINTLDVLPASLPERTVDINITTNNPQPPPGFVLHVNGTCIDSTLIYCDGLRIINQLNNNQIYIDRVINGKFNFASPVQPFVSELDFSSIFEGTGLYSNNQLNVIQATSQEIDDVGITNINISPLIFNQTGNVTFTLYNSGQIASFNIPIKVYLNSIQHASIIVPQIDPGSQLELTITFTPKIIKNALLSLLLDYTDSNTFNNRIDKNIYIDFFLPDLAVATSIDGSQPYLVGNSVNRSIVIYNLGKLVASNVLLKEYIIPDSNNNYKLFSAFYNSPTSIVFNNITYDVETSIVNSTHIIFSISSNVISQTLLSHYFDSIILDDNNLLEVTVAPTYTLFSLSKNYNTNAINIANLESADIMSQNLNLSLSSVGKYRIKGILISPLDPDTSNNIYELFINSVPLAPDLLPNMINLPLSSIVSMNRTTLLFITINNKGGAGSEDASYKLFMNSTLLNNTFIGEIPALSTSGRFVKFKPLIPGLFNMILIANTTNEYNPRDNILIKSFTAMQTKNYLFTIKNSTNHYPPSYISYPLLSLPRFITFPTSIELPYHTPFLLGIRKFILTVFLTNTTSIDFTTYYKDTIASDSMGVLSDYYENIIDNNLLLHHVYANQPNWSYSSMLYSIKITNPIIDYSNAFFYGCLDWDFTNKACLSSWTLLPGLREFKTSFGFSTINMNGSSPSMEAFALATDQTATTTILSSSSAGSSGGGGSSSSLSSNKYLELIYYKIISPEHPFSARTHNTLLDVSALGLITSKEYKNGYISVLKYLTIPDNVLPNQRLTYAYFNIDYPHIAENTITTSNITFKVPISWLASTGVSPDSIMLQRYSLQTAWQDLPTAFLSLDDTYYYFTSQTNGLSTFAITSSLPEPIIIQSPVLQTTIIQQPLSEDIKQPFINRRMLIITSISILIIIAILTILLKRKGNKNARALILKKVIEDARKQGYTNEQIIKEAQEKGWPRELIENVLK